MKPVCPHHFQERITRAGGTNRYGDPNYRLVWSQSESYRAGGVWAHDHYAGYREVYLANGSPIPPRKGYWILVEWTPPEQYGSEASYYFLNRDENTGLCLLGPYPHRGRYTVAFKLIETIVCDGVMTIVPLDLNSAIIDRFIPVILKAKNDTLKHRLEFVEAQRIRTERKLKSALDSVMNDSKRPLLLPSKIDDRIRLMEKQWAEYLANPSLQIRSGFITGDPHQTCQ